MNTDYSISAKERGRIDAGRGAALEDCPFDNPKEAGEWQEGWRQRQTMIRRLKEAEETRPDQLFGTTSGFFYGR